MCRVEGLMQTTTNEGHQDSPHRADLNFPLRVLGKHSTDYIFNKFKLQSSLNTGARVYNFNLIVVFFNQGSESVSCIKTNGLLATFYFIQSHQGMCGINK